LLSCYKHLEHAFTGADHPQVFPNPGSYILTDVVTKLLGIIMRSAYVLIIPRVVNILDARGAEYFRTTREKSFGKTLEDVVPAGADIDDTWIKIEQAFEPIIGILRSKDGKTGPFLQGDTLCYGDIVLVSFLVWAERANHEDWERMIQFGDGELQILWDACTVWIDGQGEEKEWEAATI
jgi:hypothetical protein